MCISNDEWRPFGFDDVTADAWRRRSFGPLEAALARDDGYTPFNAQRDPRGTAQFRQRWADAGFDPPDARRWHQWNFTAAEAALWHGAEFDLASASMWRTMGVSPDEAARRAEERNARDAGFDRARQPATERAPVDSGPTLGSSESSVDDVR